MKCGNGNIRKGRDGERKCRRCGPLDRGRHLADLPLPRPANTDTTFWSRAEGWIAPAVLLAAIFATMLPLAAFAAVIVLAALVIILLGRDVEKPFDWPEWW